MVAHAVYVSGCRYSIYPCAKHNVLVQTSIFYALSNAYYRFKAMRQNCKGNMSVASCGYFDAIINYRKNALQEEFCG